MSYILMYTVLLYIYIYHVNKDINKSEQAASCSRNAPLCVHFVATSSFLRYTSLAAVDRHVALGT